MTARRFRRIVCQDGFSMSVQAHAGAYCSPRECDAVRYNQVEVGFPSDPEPLLINYAENPDHLTQTVYGWVPATVVGLVIARHGGMVEGECPPGVPQLWAPEAQS